MGIKTTTPRSIDEEVLQLCKEIANIGGLQYVDVIPEQYSTFNNCFPNVKKTVEKRGGIQIYGWSIWKWTNIFIEAEAHSVWKSPEGILTDVTPHIGGEDRILFLEDKNLKYNGTMIKSIRKPLTSSPLVKEYIELAIKKEDVIINTVGKTVSLTGDIVQKMFYIENIFKSKVGRNDLCPCQSGLKYKRCCGKEN